MYGTLAFYNGSCTAGAENQLNAVTDPDITIQSNAFVFTSQYSLLASILLGASVEYGRYSTAEWSGRGRPNIFGNSRNATPGAVPFWDLFPDKKLVLPQAQQIALYATNNLGSSTEKEAALWQYCTPSWSKQSPAGMYDILLHATATITLVAGSWVENQAITFDSPPLGGVYCVLGTVVVGANAYAYRWVFPRSPMYNGRRLRPGGLVMTAFGNAPFMWGGDPFYHWGPQGYFWTYEQPLLGVLGQTAGSQALDVFMMCRFYGESPSLLDGLINQQQ